MRRWGMFALCGTLLACLGFPGTAWAQGSRKDDIVLNRFGQPVAGATVTVCTSGATGTPCSPLAAIYSDRGLTQPLANPMSSDGQGNYYFYAAPGRYMVQLSGAGVSTTTIPDVLLPADPTAPSYQSLTVTQNITAASLSLTGNLSVSGAVSSPSAVTAPQTSASTPAQLGPNWYPPATTSATCQAPAAPAVATETISSGTGNFSSATTYYIQVRLGNMNGWTPPSPSTAYTPASGTTNRALIQLSDYTYRSGCYKFQAQISSSGPNGPFYPAQAWTLPVASISSWSCAATGFCTVTTTAAHGFIPGEYVTISGAATGTSSTSINGSWTLIGQQINTPSTLFFLRSSSTADSSSTAQGTATVIAGLGSDPSSHMAPGDFIVAAVPSSGSAFPNTNTATIDPDQAALNAACNFTANSCSGGHLVMPQGMINATTPLIVSNQQTVIGDNSAVAGGKSERYCAWKDPNLACVMVMGTANGVRIEGLDVESQGYPMMATGWGPGYASMNQFIRNNNLVTSDTTGQYSAFYFHVGTWYNEHLENNFLQGSLAALQLDAMSGGWWFISGSRWNTAGGLTAGKNGNALLSVSSVTDPDRAQLRGSFPNGIGMLELSNLFSESATGVQFDAVNLGLKLKNVLTADPNANANTPAFVRVGADANAGGANFGSGVTIEDTYLQASQNVASDIQFISNASNLIGQLTLRNSGGGSTNAIDMNGVSIPTVAYNSLVFPYESATVHKIINQPSNPTIQVFGTVYDGTNNTAYAMHRIIGGVQWAMQNQPIGSGYTFYSDWISPQHMGWYWGDEKTASNLWMDWSGASGSGRFRLFQNDGATPLFDAYSMGANQVNLCNPAAPANGAFSVGCSGFRWGFQSSTAYFSFAGTPSAARTITWADSSGTPALGLSGTSSSLGGSALTAGSCSSTTVSISGATTSMAASATPASDPGAGFYWQALVSSSNTVTVRVCAAVAGTPTATTYNVRVIQ